MNDREFKAEIKKGLSGGYLLYGDEDYLKEHYIAEAKSAVVGDDDGMAALNLIECDENRFTVGALRDALSTFPMMADRVLVVFRVRLSQLREKEKQALFELLEALEDYPSAVLLLVACKGYFDPGNLKRNKPSALYKQLAKSLVPVEFAYQTPSVLKKWLARHFASDSLACSERVLDRIVALSGPDMNSLLCETEKLACYALSKGESEISDEAVTLLCSDNGELEAFALSNAIVAGDRTAALRTLRESRDKRQKANVVLAMITSDFNNMMKVSVCLSAGLYKDEIAAKTGIHPFKVSKYIDAVKDSDPERIRAALDRCREADAAIKSSRIDYIALERLVCTMPQRKYSRGKSGGR